MIPEPAATIVALAVALNIASAIWHLLANRRLNRQAQAYRDETEARVRETLDKLSQLPEWHQSILVAGFLAYLSTESSVPAPIREHARSLLPLELGILPIDQPEKVH